MCTKRKKTKFKSLVYHIIEGKGSHIKGDRSVRTDLQKCTLYIFSKLIVLLIKMNSLCLCIYFHMLRKIVWKETHKIINKGYL